MAAITAKMVKELREITAAGMMDCKKALTEKDGDMEAAITLLREKGMAKAAKKADRVAAEGLIFDVVCKRKLNKHLSEVYELRVLCYEVSFRVELN